MSLTAGRTLLFFLLLFPLLDASGLVGIGEARLVTTLVMLLVVQVVMSRFLALPPLALLSALARPVVSCVVMYVVLVVLQTYSTGYGQPVMLALLVVSGVTTYAGMSLLLWQLQGRPEGLESTVLARIFPPATTDGPS